MSNEIAYRDFRIVQKTAAQMARELRVTEEEAKHRCSVGGMPLPVVYVVRDEFDDNPMPLPGMWFEAPVMAKSAVDIHLYAEGFNRTFWPNYHDAYIAMRNCPQILRALQELHRQAVDICSDGLVDQEDFVYTARERLGRLFTDMEFNLKTT